MCIIPETRAYMELQHSCNTCEIEGAMHKLAQPCTHNHHHELGCEQLTDFNIVNYVVAHTLRKRLCLSIHIQTTLKLHVSRIQLGWKVLVAANRDALAPKKVTILVKNNGCAKQSARLNEQSNQAPLWGKSSWWLRKYQRHLDVALWHRSFGSKERKESILCCLPFCL